MQRRKFLKSVGLAAGFAAPFLAHPGRVLGANERVSMGSMGLGGRGRRLTRGFASLPDVELTTLCDVDPARASLALKEITEIQTGRKPNVVRDFRRILDDPKINCLAIATPDH